jgi:hypothetical protein
MLHNVRKRDVNEVLSGVFLAHETSKTGQAPGIWVVEGSSHDSEQNAPPGMGIAEFTQHMKSISNDFDRDTAILTGEYQNTPLRVDWLKHSLDLEAYWLRPTVDIDSVSLTVWNPEFTEPVMLHAYPSRAKTLSVDNKLAVLHNGKRKPLSHCEYYVSR